MPWQIMTRALGLDEGGYVRSALDALRAAVGFDGHVAPGYQQAAFTIAFISLAAKMAKADGVVAHVEALTFERLHSAPAEEARNVQYVFELAASDSAGYDVYASRIRDTLSAEPRLLRDVLDALFHIAAADGVFHGREEVFLADVAGIFGISDGEFRSIRAAFVHDGRSGIGNDDPYDILGISRDVSDAQLKSHYRQLVRDHHPDSLIARGVPAEFHAAAEQKLAGFNAAYERVLEERAAKGLGSRLAALSGSVGE